ncbi:MAG: hypothetical protein ACKESB_00515, partial [Candidatus Hodgkinia cicadicola]
FYANNTLLASNKSDRQPVAFGTSWRNRISTKLGRCPPASNFRLSRQQNRHSVCTSNSRSSSAFQADYTVSNLACLGKMNNNNMHICGVGSLGFMLQSN